MGGIWPIPSEATSGVTLFVEVESVKDYVQKAKEQGAEILIPHQVLPDGDEMALILDPEGIALGLFTPAGGVAS